MIDKFEAVVVGSGISGLYVANELIRSGVSVLLIAPEIGGLLAQVKLNGYTFDFGGHVYSGNNDRIKTLFKETGVEVTHHRRDARYLSHEFGQIDYPVQGNAEEIGLKIQPNAERSGHSLKDYAQALFGDEFYEKWFRPFNKRVWTVDPSKMSSDWISLRVPPATSKSWGPNSTFVYTPGDELIHTLLETFVSSGGQVYRGKAVLTLGNRHILHLDDGTDIKYSKLFATTLDFLKEEITFNPTLLQNRILTIGIGFRPDRLFEWDDIFSFHWAYNDVKRQGHRITMLHKYSPSLAPFRHGLIIAEYPHSPMLKQGKRNNTHVYFSDPQKLATKVAEDFGLPLPIDKAETGVTIDFIGYPIPLLETRKNVYKIKRQLAKKNIYACGRWGSHAYFNVEHCLDDADAMLEYAFYASSENEYFWSSHYYDIHNDKA